MSTLDYVAWTITIILMFILYDIAEWLITLAYKKIKASLK